MQLLKAVGPLGSGWKWGVAPIHRLLPHRSRGLCVASSRPWLLFLALFIPSADTRDSGQAPGPLQLSCSQIAFLGINNKEITRLMMMPWVPMSSQRLPDWDWLLLDGEVKVRLTGDPIQAVEKGEGGGGGRPGGKQDRGEVM